MKLDIFTRFRSDFKMVLQLINAGKDKAETKRLLEENKEYLAPDAETGRLINVLTKLPVDYVKGKKGERASMCNAVKELLAEGRETGLEEGRAKGLAEGRAEGRAEERNATRKILVKNIAASHPEWTNEEVEMEVERLLKE